MLLRSSCGEEAGTVSLRIICKCGLESSGSADNSEFQLITWSKDKTLRFWPIDTDMIQVCAVLPYMMITL